MNWRPSWLRAVRAAALLALAAVFAAAVQTPAVAQSAPKIEISGPAVTNVGFWVTITADQPVKWNWPERWASQRLAVKGGEPTIFDSRTNKLFYVYISLDEDAEEVTVKHPFAGLIGLNGYYAQVSNEIKVAIDRVAPTVTKVTSRWSLAHPVPRVTYEFSEEIRKPNISAWSCTARKGSSSVRCLMSQSPTKVSATTWHVWPKASGGVSPDSITVTLDLSDIQDPAVNFGSGTHETVIEPDNTPPKPKLRVIGQGYGHDRAPVLNGIVNGDFTVAVVENDADLAGITARALFPTNGRVVFRQQNDEENFVEFTIRPLHSGPVKVVVLKDRYRDPSGNLNEVSNTVTVTARLANAEPAFPQDTVTYSVAEGGPANTLVATLPAASDADRVYRYEDLGGGATAASLVPRDTLTYAVVKGKADAASFTFDPGTRRLTLKPAPDYETAPLEGGERQYRVKIAVRDGKGADGSEDSDADDELDVTVKITNVDEPGKVVLARVPQVGEPLEAVLTDPDGIVGTVSWHWVRSYNGVWWHGIPGANTNPYTPDRHSQNWFVEARADYTDGHGPKKRATGHRREGQRGGDRMLPPRPAKPSGVKAVPGDGEMRLTWSDPRNGDISGYEVRRREAAEEEWGDWTAIESSGKSTTRHTVSGLVNRTRYAFQLRALSTRLGTGDPSDPVEAAPLPSDQVRGVKVVPQFERLSLTWERVAGASGYKVQWKSGGEAFAAAREHTLSGAAATRYTIPRLRGLVTYTVRVIATKAGASDGAPSDTATGAPLAPALSITSPRVDEGDSGTVALTWTVGLSPASAHEVRVRYADAGSGTATEGTDYAEATGVLTFAAGDTAKTFSVQVNGDTEPEPDETVTMRLSNAVNASIAAADGTGTIADDDMHPPKAPAGLAADERIAPVTKAPDRPRRRHRGTDRSRCADRPADDTVTKWQVRRDAGAWTDVPGSGAGTRSHRVDRLTNGVQYRLNVRAVNPVGPGPPRQVKATPVGASPAAHTVRASETFVPRENNKALAAGSKFRLLFVTSTGRSADSPHVRDYNRFVQAAAARNGALSSFSGEFRALVSTETVDARDNSATTGTGVPVYWINGEKAADSAAALYGTAGSRAGRDESGKAVAASRRIWTGSSADGTKQANFWAGARRPTVTELKAGTSILAHARASSSEARRTNALLAISPVLTVGALSRQLASPQNVKAAPGPGSLAVTWNAVSSATGYKVQWKSGSDGYGPERQASGITATNYTIPGLAAGTAYRVRVFATAADHPDSRPSAEASGTPTEPPAARVANVRAIPGVGELAVTWDAVAGAGGYKVQWKSGGESYGDTRQRTVAEGTTTRDVVPGLTPGTAYTVRVIATKADAPDGPPSAEATGTPTALGRVSGVSLEPGAGELAVTWDAVAGAGGYKVQWKSGGESYGDTRQRTVAEGTTTRDVIPALTPTAAYTVRVIATKTQVPDGPPSAEATVTLPALNAIPPKLTVTGVPSRISATTGLTVTFTFDEAVSGFTASDVTVTRGTLSGFTEKTAGTVWTATVTPDGYGDLEVTVAAGAATDGDGNAGPVAAVTRTAAYDDTAPTLTVAGVPKNIDDGRRALAVSFAFSEPVTGFTAADVTVTNGALSGLKADAAKRVWTATVTSDGQGDLAVSVAKDSVADGHGNLGPPAEVRAVAASRRTPPTAVITGMPAVIKTSNLREQVCATVVFSEPVTELERRDFTPDGADLAGFNPDTTRPANTAWKVCSHGIFDDYTLTLEANTVTDRNGNLGPPAAVSATAVYDADAPLLTIGGVPERINTTAALSVTFTFDEAVSGFAAGDVTVANGALGALAVTARGRAWKATVTPDGSGDLTVTVAKDAVTDGGGTDGPAAAVSATAVYDADAPKLEIGGVPPRITSRAPLTASFTFDEPVTDFRANDLTVENGALSGFAAAVAGTKWTVTVTPDGGGDVTVGARAGAAVDRQGNRGPEAAVMRTVQFDATRPGLTVQLPEKIGADTTEVQAEFRFTEFVKGFTAADIEVTGGSVGKVVAASTGEEVFASTQFVAPVTPDMSGNLEVTVKAHSVSDFFDLTGPEAPVRARSEYDDTAPTVTIEGIPPKINSTAALKVQFRFSEAVTGFTAADVTVTNGALSGFASDADAAADTVWTATVTPDGTGDLTVEVAADAVADTYGNAGPAQSASATATWDATRPEVTIAGHPESFTFPAALSMTFTFGEAVTGFTAADVTVTNGTLSGFANDADAAADTVWKATVTPDGTGDLEVEVAADAVADGHGNTGPETAAAVTATYVAPVYDLRVAPDVKALRASWDEIDGADSYEVQWKSGTQAWSASERQKEILAPLTNHLIEGLSAGTRYAVRVTATSGAADAEPSAEVEGVPVANLVPAFLEGETARREVAEDAAAGDAVGLAVKAADSEGETLTYALSGTGHENFAIDGNGQITVASGATLDYEAVPSYTLTADVHDGKDAANAVEGTPSVDDSIEITVAVTNVDEAGSVTFGAETPAVGVAFAASVEDPDGSVSAVTWQWSRSDTQGGTYADISGATSASYTPVADDAGKWLQASASYTDVHGPNKSASAQSENATTARPAKPTGLTATAKNEQVGLAWADPNDATITGYQFQQKAGDGNYGAWTDIPDSAPGEANATSYTVTRLKNGTAYAFRIRAVNAAGNGPQSDAATATPSAPARIPTSGTGTTVWSATLTVDESSEFYGCDNDDGSQGDCSDSSVLSKDEFMHAGATYTVTRFYWSSPDQELVLALDGTTGANAKTALGSLMLHLGSHSLAVSAASTSRTALHWAFNPSPAWRDGDEVEVLLIEPDTTAPTVTPASTGYYSDAALQNALTEPQKSGADIYTKVTFSEDMGHTASDTASARPEIFHRIGTTDTQYDILDQDGTLASGDCKPNHASETDEYVCRYTVGGSDNGAFTVKVGTGSADKADNALAAEYIHSDTLVLDTTDPGISFPSGVTPRAGTASTITLTDAGSKVAKYAVIEVAGTATDATGCDDPSSGGDNFSTTAVNPAASPEEVSYTPVTEGKKICVYAEDAAGNGGGSLWPTAIAAADTTVPTVTSGSTGYYSDAALSNALTGPQKSGAEIYTKVTFSEDMGHTASDTASARPEIFHRIESTDTQYDILASGGTLASGDCKPNHASETDEYVCLYTVGGSDNGAFTVKVGTNSADKASNALAARPTPTRRR